MTNSNSNFTPGDMFRSLLSNSTPAALAWVRGGVSYPDISGLVKFFHTPYGGILVEAEIFNLPNISTAGSSGFYAMHIHEYGDCSAGFTKPEGTMARLTASIQTMPETCRRFLQTRATPG